jgi:Ser/Thr protein kinase RdoA (MazF antagonist)
VTLTPAAATDVLAQASAVAGVDPRHAVLVRLGSNAVFRLTTAPVIVRVAQGGNSAEAVLRQLDVARWLADEGVRAVRAWALPSGLAQPVLIDGRAVTFWESVNDEDEYGNTAELGQILRRLHSLKAPTRLTLPPHDPFGKTRDRLARASELDDAERGFLSSRSEELAAVYQRLPWRLPPGPIHDDANVGNLLRDRDGRPVLSDLDGFCIGPREWDLIQTALFYDRLGWHTEQEYRDFVDAYGYDLMQWSGYETLADVREVVMTAWLASTAQPGTEAAEELARRISDLRTGASRRGWCPL